MRITRSGRSLSNSQSVLPPSSPSPRQASPSPPLPPASATPVACGTSASRAGIAPMGAKRSSEEAEVVVSTKKIRDGRTKVFWHGYEYTRASITSVKIVYRCSFWRRGCPAKLVFLACIMEYDYANATDHTCARPNIAGTPSAQAPRDVTAVMKIEVQRLAIETTLTPMSVWTEVREHFYVEGEVVRGLMREQVVKLVHRVRAAHFGGDMHGRIEVPPLSRVKNSNLSFFQFHYVWFDSASKQPSQLSRVVGWAHPAAIQLLRYANVSLFVDGTFRIVPAKFKQCVVLMVYDRGCKLFIPVFFVLTTSKTFDTYWNLFQLATNACGQKIAASNIVCDFEAPLVNAVTDWWPDATTIGCLFHFKQACTRRLTKYRVPPGEVKIAMESGVLDMLSVIEVEKIPKQGVRWVKTRIRERCAEEDIAYSTKKWASFWKYFKRTWLVLFPPTLWNIRNCQARIVARTNNPLERFNRELNAAFATPHPSLARFVHTMEEISRKYMDHRNDIANGRAKPPSRVDRMSIPTAVELPDSEGEDSEESEADDEGGEDHEGDDEDEIRSQDVDGYDYFNEDADAYNGEIIDDEGYVHI